MHAHSGKLFALWLGTSFVNAAASYTLKFRLSITQHSIIGMMLQLYTVSHLEKMCLALLSTWKPNGSSNWRDMVHISLCSRDSWVARNREVRAARDRRESVSRDHRRDIAVTGPYDTQCFRAV